MRHEATRSNAETGLAGLSNDWRLPHGRIAQAGSETDLTVNECVYSEVGGWQQPLAELRGQCTGSSEHGTAKG